jgi:hypothetical protein
MYAHSANQTAQVSSLDAALPSSQSVTNEIQPPPLDEQTSNLAVAVEAQQSDVSSDGAKNDNAQPGKTGSAKDETPAKAEFADKNVDSEQEKAELRELQQRDREVRAHEQAHIAAGGGVVTGGASFTYQTGPDGKQYAIGGEVGVDASSVPGNPEATERKAETVRRAALAPADPSGQDRKVAAEAEAMASEARRDKIKERKQEQGDNAPGETYPSSGPMDAMSRPIYSTLSSSPPGDTQPFSSEEIASAPADPTALAETALATSSALVAGAPWHQQALSSYARLADANLDMNAREAKTEAERAAPFSAVPGIDSYA